MNLTNLTGQRLLIRSVSYPAGLIQDDFVLEPEGTIAELETDVSYSDMIPVAGDSPQGERNIVTETVRITGVHGVGDPRYEHYYVVPPVVAQYLTHRGDVLTPDRASTARDGDRLVVTRFVRYAK